MLDFIAVSAIGTVGTFVATAFLAWATIRLVRATHALENRARIDQERREARFTIRDAEAPSIVFPLRDKQDIDVFFRVMNSGWHDSAVGSVQLAFQYDAGGRTIYRAREVYRWEGMDVADPSYRENILVRSGDRVRVRARFEASPPITGHGVKAVLLIVDPVIGPSVEHVLIPKP